MARKSKGKFNMKGHSIPGIKGFKSTTLGDGRAESSAFQMKSPFQERPVLGDDTDLDLTDPTEGEKFSEGIDKSYGKGKNESATDFTIRQIRLLQKEREALKEQKENNATKLANKLSSSNKKIKTTK